MKPLFSGKTRPWLPPLIWTALAGLLVFQAWAYFERFPLILNPRVILQPWLLTRGFVMYENIADLHTPLLPLLLSKLAVLFQDGFKLARYAIVLLLTLTTGLTFAVAGRRNGRSWGLWAAWFFAVWSPTFLFYMLWHETLLAPLYLLWLMFYDPSANRRSLRSSFLLGCLGGAAVMVKQHAAVPFIAFIAWDAFTVRRNRRSLSDILRGIGFVGLGAVLVVSAYGVYQYVQAGTLKGFLYWTVAYNLTSDYRSMLAQLPNMAQIGVMASCGLLVPAAVFCLVDSKSRKDPAWMDFGMLLLLMATASVTAYPRFEMYHLQPAVPIVALLSSRTLAYALRPKNPGRFFAAGAALALSAYWTVTAGYAYRPTIRPEPERSVWEYAALAPLAEEIKKRIGPDDGIFIFPDAEINSNLYYLMRSPPPKYWIFHYPWYMTDQIKKRILKSLEDSPPKWVIYFPDRYGVSERASEIRNYIQSHYRRAASLPWVLGEVLLLGRLRQPDAHAPK